MMNQEQQTTKEESQQQPREGGRVQLKQDRTGQRRKRRRSQVHPNPLQPGPDGQEMESNHLTRYRE
jgi:hypothetical protein